MLAVQIVRNHRVEKNNTRRLDEKERLKVSLFRSFMTISMGMFAVFPVRAFGPETLVAAGIDHTIVIIAQGRLMGSGSNQHGQLGVSSGSGKAYYAIPAGGGLSDIRKVSAGCEYNLALDGQARVWSWGRNETFQLGHGLRSQAVPRQLEYLPESVVDIAAGCSFGMALDADGNLWAWGENRFGELGDGYIDKRYIPWPVLQNVKTMAGGYDHGLAVLSDGMVMAWGRNDDGRLGDGGWDIQLKPVAVKDLTNVIEVAAGAEHSLALDADGRVWSWGEGDTARLGNGSGEDRNFPVQVQGLPTIQQISIGNSHNLALDHTGRVWVWGANDFGQAGTGTSERLIIEPRMLATPEDVVMVASGASISFAVARDGVVWGWGTGEAGELGNGGSGTQTTPLPMIGVKADVSLLGTGKL